MCTEESQTSDEGRYIFKYNDINGKHRYLYGNCLEKTDEVLPKGIRKPTLRDPAEELQAKINAGTLTVYELVEKYVLLKIGAREGTR